MGLIRQELGTRHKGEKKDEASYLQVSLMIAVANKPGMPNWDQNGIAAVFRARENLLPDTEQK